MPTSVNARDFYVVLDIPQSADSAQIRRAYREQALLHHPDKNPDRLEEATERFKMIAEAYSVLHDAESRAAYDNAAKGCSVNVGEHSDCSPPTDFSDAKARDLFRDVFGEDVAHAVHKVASGVIHTAHSFHTVTNAAAAAAGDRCGKVGVVRNAVAAGLSSRTLEADAKVAEQARDEESSKVYWQKRVKLLHDHEESVAAAQQARQQMQPSIFERLKLKAQRDSAEDAAFDRAATQKSALLRKMVHQAAADWQGKRDKLQDAEAAALLAREEVEDVQQNGASLGRAAHAGALLLSRLKRKLRGSDGSSSVSKAQCQRAGNADVRRSQSYCR